MSQNSPIIWVRRSLVSSSRRVEQEQQIHVGAGEELFPPVAADGHQGRRGGQSKAFQMSSSTPSTRRERPLRMGSVSG
jgi:hypothetical protein